MRNFGLWATNSGQNPNIDGMADLVQDGCYTIMHSGYSVDEARYIKERFPDADILVRHHCPEWRIKNPVDWAQKVVERMQDYKGLGILRLVGANEPNLETHNDFSRQMFVDFGNWYSPFAREVRRLDPTAIIHLAAMAAGHNEDLPHPVEGWIGYHIPEMVEAASLCDWINHHTYWEPDDGPHQVFSRRGGGRRYLHAMKVHADVGIVKPVWIDEAGPWAQPWQWEQVAAHSEQCQRDGVKVTYFLWADPTNNQGNTINQWWGRVEEEQLDKLREEWWRIEHLIPADIPPAPPPIVQVWGDEAITPWREFCEIGETTDGVDSKVLGTMIYIESSGEENATGADGEIGLMQIISSEVFPERPSPERLFNPAFNVSYGSGLMAGYLSQYDLRCALMAYNAGPGWMDANPEAADTSVGYLMKFAQAWAYLWEADLPWLDKPLLSPPFSETRAKVEEAARQLEIAIHAAGKAHRWVMEAIEELRRIEGV